MAITVSHKGYIKRTSLDEYRFQGRGGAGTIGMRLPDDDYVQHLFVASTHAYLIVYSDRGRAYWLRVHEIPDAGRDARGKSIANLVQMTSGEKVADVVAVRDFPSEEGQRVVVMGTRKGVIKKTDLKAYSNPRVGGIIAMGVDDDDEVIAVRLSTGTNHVFIGTAAASRSAFPENRVRTMGRTAYGVRAISLRRRRRGRGDGGGRGDRLDADRHRQRLRQAHAAGRVPHHRPRRARDPQHPVLGSQRPRRRHHPRRRRQPGADHHRRTAW